MYRNVYVCVYVYKYIYIYIFIDLLFRRRIIVQPIRPDKSCVSWPSGAYPFAQLARSISEWILRFWGVRKVVLDSMLDARSNLERSLLKSCQCSENVAKIAARGCVLEHTGSSEGPAREALGTVCTSFWRLRVVFLTICLQKCVFEILRIATFVRLGDQVGATWAQKSRPSRPKSPRTGKSEGAGQSSQTGRCRSCGNDRKSPELSPDLSQVGGQSLSKRQVIWLDLLYMYMHLCVNILNMCRRMLHPFNYTELLYADNIILTTNNFNPKNRLLAKVEGHASWHALSSNIEHDTI